jgi:PAS domain S-box-containing protein
MPPLLWAAVRFELTGAVVTLTLLALITAIFTISGASQFAGDPESQRHKQIMLQLFLAISALSALIVAAISRQHQLAVLTLRKSERSLRELVETLPAHIWCTAPDGNPTYFSKQFRDFIGFNVEDKDVDGVSRLSSVLNAIIHPDDLGRVNAIFADSLATGKSCALKHRQRRFDGQYRWVETRASAMRNSDDAIVQWNVICLDIDGEVRVQEELRLAQARLARASQVASLAELSASIAHEVNQPLAAVVNNASACVRWLATQNLEEARQSALQVVADGHRTGDIISRIRTLFSQRGQARSLADMNEVISEVRRLLANELAVRNVQVKSELDQSLPAVTIDRVQMQQVLVNLIHNAVDALDAAVDGPRQIRIRSVRDDADAIRVEVRDLGVGVKEPERIFEPFFSTKRGGMGMGLAICRSIIEAHDGRLWVTGNEPSGTTLAFTLPIRTRDAT